MVTIWSLNFVFAKVALEEIPPLALPALRTSIAAVCAAILLAFERRREPREGLGIARESWPRLVLAATCGITLNQFFYAISVKNTSIAHSSLIMALTPLAALLIAVVARHEQATFANFGGMFVALAGVVLLQLAKADGGAAGLLGDLAAVACALSFGAYSVVGKPLSEKYDALTLNAWSNVIAAACLIPIALIPGIPFSRLTAGAWLGVLYMGVMGSTVAYVIYAYALKHMRSSHVAMYAYIQPILATFFALLFLREPITWPMCAAGMLILLGVWISGRSK
jgi:drug/metabolite transporter (DMT)-like permease